MSSILLLGVVVGCQHALEADHVAAVSSIVAEERSAKRILGHGASWAVGHMVTIMICVVAAMWFGGTIDPAFSWVMELGVGIMICGLGARLIYRQCVYDVRFSVHRHHSGLRHFHAHQADLVDHGHKGHGTLGSLFIGMMHGLAGSAALLVLAVTATGGGMQALRYVAAFGVGSVIGMTALTGVIALPLRNLNRLQWAPRILRLAMGALAIVVGGVVVVRQVMAAV